MLAELINVDHGVLNEIQRLQLSYIQNRAERKACLCSHCLPSGEEHTFRALPSVPQVLHTDKLVIPVEAVMLGLGVMVV